MTLLKHLVEWLAGILLPYQRHNLSGKLIFLNDDRKGAIAAVLGQMPGLPLQPQQLIRSTAIETGEFVRSDDRPVFHWLEEAVTG